MHNPSVTAMSGLADSIATILQKSRICLTETNPGYMMGADISHRVILLCLLHLCMRRGDEMDGPAPSELADLVCSIDGNEWVRSFFPELSEYALADVSECYATVSTICSVKEWRALFPYALETFEYTSEQFFGSSVSRGIHKIGYAKKHQGIYYTPEDVIEFMIEHCESHFNCTDAGPGSYLDCSCGTGVFLLHIADCRLQNEEGTHDAKTVADIVQRFIWGIDISPVAVLNSKFMFMVCAYERSEKARDTERLWEILDTHIICGDSSRLGDFLDRHPEMPRKYDCIIGNPPYVTMDGKDNLFIRFVENMIDYSSGNSCSALVLPLSVTCSRNKSFIQLRRKILDDKGASWRFANFDRTPDSLFGDHVKTRNTIAFRTAHEDCPRHILSSGIIRWTSENRDNLFTDIRYADVQDVMDSSCIPKLQSCPELDAYKKLRKGGEPLSFLLWHKNGNGGHHVAVSGTAYNWICAYDHLPPSEDLNGNPYIPSSMALYTLPSQDDVYFCVAMLSNRITYWYWTATGDEFHVSSRLYETLYLGKGSFTPDAFQRVVSLGREYCRDIIKHPTCSYNAGKKVVNYDFRPLLPLVRSCEAEIVKAKQIDPAFLDYIADWHYRQVFCGRSRIRQ